MDPQAHVVRHCDFPRHRDLVMSVTIVQELRRSLALSQICDACDSFAQVCDPMLGRVTPIIVKKLRGIE